MKISGFTFIRNGSKLCYPFLESIKSVLDLVDEFVIALGDGDPDDKTHELLDGIGSEKIKIVHTRWDLEKYQNGTEHAHQTDIAKNACNGDWLLYLQADEVIHEEDHPVILAECKAWLDTDIEGMVFNYIHFWGDYNHYQISHGWYKNEIRIIRNHPDIHSFVSAQSFRVIPDFDGFSYRQKKGTRKLKCIKSRARVFHYGWVRPPDRMQLKREYIDTNHHGKALIERKKNEYEGEFDYGNMTLLPEYNGNHPAVMSETINNCSWQETLRFSGGPAHGRKKHKHERLKYRLITLLEQFIFNGRPLFESRNYKLVGSKVKWKK